MSGGGGPAHGVGQVHFNLAHAFVAVLQHAFMPLGVEHAGAGFQGHLFGQGAHDAIALGLVANVDRWRLSSIALCLMLGLQYRSADAA